MIKPKHSTNIKLKVKHLPQFIKLIENQLNYGGTKYAQDEEKESTDYLAEMFGQEWVLGTMTKYVLRYKNLGREKDLLKIAAYCYIIWLQSGFHLNEDHDEDVK